MRLGSLFAGIGGFDLAARWMGWETAWFSEVDPYASAVLAKHWPGVPNHGDITAIDFTQVESVDMLVGGFPCQDISNAGKRAGIAGERSGLWGEYARAIGELRPRYVVVENVAALLGRGVERVLGDLAALGYDAEWQVLSAADVGAPHLRERLWIVAYPNGNVREGRPVQGAYGKGRQRAETEPAVVRRRGQLCADDLGSGSETLADAYGARLPYRSEGDAGRERGAGGNASDCSDSAGRSIPDAQRERLEGIQPRRTEAGTTDGSSNGRDPGWWATEPDVGRVAHGVPARVDRLTCLGNSLVPRCAFAIFQEIEAAEEREQVT